jgi:hypothetical protein
MSVLDLYENDITSRTTYHFSQKKKKDRTSIITKFMKINKKKSNGTSIITKNIGSFVKYRSSIQLFIYHLHLFNLKPWFIPFIYCICPKLEQYNINVKLHYFRIILNNIEITDFLYCYNKDNMCMARAAFTFSRRKKTLTMTLTTTRWTRLFYLTTSFGISIQNIFLFWRWMCIVGR